MPRACVDLCKLWIALGLLGLAALGLACDEGESSAPAAQGGGASGGSTPQPIAAGAAGASGAGGEPLALSDEQWQWVEFSETTCRDGSAAGLSVQRLAAATRVMVYLEGGGSCYDVETCAGNPARVTGQTPASVGMFDRANADNPVRDWSFVYVPYCSGDVHSGDASDVAVDGVSGSQQFKGRKNLESFLERLVPTFRDAEQVLLTGFSAGGSGAILNYGLVQRAFGAIPVVLIDDSGPVLSVDHLPACLNQLRRRYWGWDRSVIAECGSACDPTGDFLLQFVRQTLGATRERSALIHSIHDEVIRSFYGIATHAGLNDCGGKLGETPMDPALFEAGLLDTRAQLQAASPGFGSYYPDSTQHGWTTSPALYTQATGGVRLVDWFRGVLAGAQATQI